MAESTTERSWTHPGRPELHRVDINGGQSAPAEDGPWWQEPDKVQWIDLATDLDCLAVRQHFGVWCGYVGLPPGHPWLGGWEEEPDVHGGITYGPAACDEDAEEGHGICHVPFPGRPADVAWIGFDCGHAFDYMPGMAALAGANLLGRATYRTLGYVREECARLAEQAQAGAR